MVYLNYSPEYKPLLARQTDKIVDDCPESLYPPIQVCLNSDENEDGGKFFIDLLTRCKYQACQLSISGAIQTDLMPSLSVQDVSALKPCVLLVDDELFNLEILEELLEDHGIHSDAAENGREAVKLLTANPDKYQAVLLDRMMPDMGGIEVTHFMKQHPRLRMIPIIMQTAKATKQDIEEGLGAGILYYLTKPFAKEDLLTIVDTALRYFYDYQDLCEQLDQQQPSPQTRGSIEISSISEARNSATALAQLAQDPVKVVSGLFELLVNAIEHGNLGIGFEMKSELQKSGKWLQEIERRTRLPENQGKKVLLEYHVDDGGVCFNIKDEGKGFNYQEYLMVSASRSLNMNGRGIAIAKILSFDSLKFIEPGNQVVARSVAL